MDALDWKHFYAEERRLLGTAGLDRLLDAAPSVRLEPGGALVFPHTRLTQSGELIAAAAKACVHAGAAQVLALGVLHGARRVDAPLVVRARAGDAEAVRELRRVHGPGLPGEHWTDEFSLDAFRVLLQRAAERAGRPAPTLLERYPFLVGTTPHELPGIEELALARRHGAVLVATTDPLHHGVGYGTPAEALRSRTAPDSEAFARASVERSLQLLNTQDFQAFQEHTQAARSDFRDTGPVLAALLAPWREAAVERLALVDYSDVLGAPEPTWVAGALVSIRR